MKSKSRQHILSRLSTSSGALSGDALAQELGISRAAIWKHVDALRKQGANIQSHAGQGYQLCTDFFSAATLQAQCSNLHRIGKHIQHFDSLDSSNREAMRQAEAGAKEGTVIVADQQSAGRGRLGRTWHTVGESLALSIILRPPLSPEKVSQLSLLTAVALQHALSQYCNNIRIKWPNDLLINGAKVSGILTEMRAEPGLVHAVIVGIGINIKAPEQGWPSDISQTVTDLESHHKKPISRLQCATSILKSMDQWYATYLQDGFAPIRAAWWQAHAASGQKVRVHDGKSYIEGVAQALDDDGALLLATQDGIQRIIAGELELLEKKVTL
ncbi:MAG: biotin--[acetyl-CoA-carboxylase] ligase [Mariprofundaceae bacterium]|nr:biotin--[acetyl-CoA-carboxylase] ligase [Mariprofundaceae bacterium]